MLPEGEELNLFTFDTELTPLKVIVTARIVDFFLVIVFVSIGLVAMDTALVFGADL